MWPKSQDLNVLIHALVPSDGTNSDPQFRSLSFHTCYEQERHGATPQCPLSPEPPQTWMARTPWPPPQMPPAAIGPQRIAGRAHLTEHERRGQSA